jgi:hypothetical protein
MTRIAALAYAAHATAPAFNSDLYTTAAVIPVLFLAINVQLASRYATGLIVRNLPRVPLPLPSSVILKATLPALMIAYAIIIILILGVVGEIITIVALANMTATAQVFILLVMALLTTAAAGGPIFQIFQIRSNLWQVVQTATYGNTREHEPQTDIPSENPEE